MNFVLERKESAGPDEFIYHYKKNRQQQSRLFIRMGIACWVYIAGLYGYEIILDKTVPDDLRLIWLGAFSVSSVILFYVAWWHIKNPATYEATISNDRFIVSYPSVAGWSFDIKISDIKRFENRLTLSHAGVGIMQHGVLLKDGSFHHIPMNYGTSINKM
jgi:hypothetical protein